MKANKLFSVNLVAFIYMITKKEPELGFDPTGKTYFIYPATLQNTLIINVYRNNHVSVDLKDYLSAYRHIRSLMRSVK